MAKHGMCRQNELMAEVLEAHANAVCSYLCHFRVVNAVLQTQGLHK